MEFLPITACIVVGALILMFILRNAESENVRKGVKKALEERDKERKWK